MRQRRPTRRDGKRGRLCQLVVGSDAIGRSDLVVYIYTRAEGPRAEWWYKIHVETHVGFMTHALALQ